MSTSTRSVTLHCTEGGSDKIYRLDILPKGNDYVVDYQNGRRGGTMQSGTKTAQPVALEEADKVFDKVLKEKLKKGYRVIEGDAEGAIQRLDAPKQTIGFRLQLLTPVGEDEIERYILDSRYYGQEKFNGVRRAVAKHGDKVTGCNKDGQIVPLPVKIEAAFQSLPGNLELDAEQVGDRLFAFDLLSRNEVDMRSDPYRLRYERLDALFSRCPCPVVTVAPLAIGTGQKRKLVKKLQDNDREGVVFKQLDAHYEEGKHDTQVKIKFWANLTAFVAALNLKRSVRLEVMNGAGRVDVGSVTIPPNKDIPLVGAVVEVRYLYAEKSHKLHQPSYLGLSEATESGCCLAQLKYKPDVED